MRFLLALTLALSLAPSVVAASEPPRPLRPEVCPAEQRPAVTFLAVPARVRASAHRADLVVRAHATRPSHTSSAAPWLLLAIAAGAVSLVAGSLLL